MISWRWMWRFLVTFCLIVGAKLLFDPLIAIQAQPTPNSTPEVVDESSTSESNASESSSLLVGIYRAAPLTIKRGNDWDGIAVDLWQEISRNLDIDYEWKEIKQSEAIARVEDGTVDLAIAAIAKSTDEDRVDFTHSYYTTSIGVAQRPQRSFFQIVKAVISPNFLRITFWLSIIFIILGILVWAFERNQNDQFEKHPAQGIWTGFWWAGVTMTTIGYGDKAPKTIGGRILALIWMLIAMGITASLTASITSVLAVNSPLQTVQFPQELFQLEVGSIPGSESATYLEKEGIQFQSFSAPLEGLQAVKKGDLDLFVYSAAPLRYLNRHSLQRILQVQLTDVRSRRYSFALPEGSELYETLNQQVLQEIDESDWRNLVERYLPTQKS
ncbi:transporter substrate-binding domain-containing protein [Oscillatoria salina]|uniref:transporter substrate-binding domain-containing protein n=1 Tax=Oscillatoria salina TaxID=331517 RepID=UPI0013BCB9AE|nr:transporter substrate-binding domain-containing protein [Oscillatoria salina]MBZ8179245.1 transporter substrate-binding domain-containing protein [Oscillatoria salina IIICB1]NET89551.1 transporter substrate-binding domain-containing protein [Kamptonema sp. SIO1D9]